MTQKDSSEKGKTSAGDTSAGQLKFTMMPQTLNEIMENGRMSGELLSSTVYNLAYQSVIQAIQDEMIYTDPHESRKRDWLHLKILALSSVQAELQQMMLQAQAVDQEKLKAETLAQQIPDEFQSFRDTSDGYPGH